MHTVKDNEEKHPDVDDQLPKYDEFELSTKKRMRKIPYYPCLSRICGAMPNTMQLITTLLKFPSHRAQRNNTT